MPGGTGSLRLFVVLVALAAPAGAAEFLSSHTWTGGHSRHGGFSAIDVATGGTRFVAMSDRNTFVDGRIVRRDGGIVGVEAGTYVRLKDRDGGTMSDPRGDSEGLARGPDGTLYVSFEGPSPRVWAYAAPGALPAETAPSPDFRRLQDNSGLEGLALDPEGRLLAIPERSGALDEPFPVWRLDGGTWREAFRVTRRGDHLPVSLDVGPDGRVYLLERHFAGIFGFSTRLRRFAADGTGEETLLTTPAGRHDNLEGLSVWRAPDGGLRGTMISDDNFRFFQRTELVEYALPD